MKIDSLYKDKVSNYLEDQRYLSRVCRMVLQFIKAIQGSIYILRINY